MRSATARTPGTRIVVLARLRGTAPLSRRAPISRSTRLRPTRMPSRRRAAWTRRAPYVPRLSWWILVIRATSHASARARSDGGRRSQAWKPERETPSSRHISEIEWLAFSAAMNRYRLTASRSPSRRRPRLFSGSPAPARAAAPAGAAHAAPRARRRSGHRARHARSVPAAPTAAATHATPPDPGQSPRACDQCVRTARPPHGETPAGTASGTSASLAWPDSLSAGPDSPALSCPPNRGHSKARAVAHQVQPPARPLALGPYQWVGEPDRRHQVAARHFGQHPGVDAVGLAGERRQ